MLKNLLSFSIHNRIIVILLTFFISIYGIYTLKNLPIDIVPDITNNQVQINAIAAGLSPLDIEQQVMYPIENFLASIPGLEMIRSLSRNGFGQVTAIFKEDVDIYFARQQIHEKLSEAKELFPPGIEVRLGPIATGLGEVYMWTVNYKHPGGKGTDIQPGQAGWQLDGSYLTPEGHSLKSDVELASYLRTVQDWIIRPRLRFIPNLADVDVIGGYAKEYHILPDPQKMRAQGITFTELANALEENNLSAGAGYVEQSQEAYLVRADMRIKHPEQLLQIVIQTREGIPITVSDVVEVGIGQNMRTGSASYNGQESVVGTALMLIGANSRSVAQMVDEKINQINQALPPDIQITTTLNRIKLVNATIRTVAINLTEGALLVIFILFAFLNNLRAAFIVACVIPLAMLITAIGMFQFKISGNLMSLGALDFGLIVDGAVIIVENCLRRISQKRRALGKRLSGSERLEEISLASHEMIRPTVYGQLVIILVYFPILTFTGVEGKMFYPMAMTVILALVAAFVLSLTFVPAMLATFISDEVSEYEQPFITQAKRWYRYLLDKTLRFPTLILVSSIVLVGASFFVFTGLGQEFIPTLDEKDIAMHAMRIPSTSLNQSSHMQLQVEKALLEQPEVDYVFSKTGTADIAFDPMPPNVSDTFIILKPQDQWPDSHLSKNRLIEQIQSRLEELPGHHYEFLQPIQMRFNELIAGVRSDLAIKIYGNDYKILESLAQQIANIIQQIPGAADLRVSQTQGQPLLDIAMKDEVASRIGLKRKDIVDLVSTAIGGRKAGVIFEEDRRFDLVVKLPETIRQDLTKLEELPVQLPSKDSHSFIPLKEIASLTLTEGTSEIKRENGKRVLIVQTNVRGRDLGSFVEEAKDKISQQIQLSTDYWIEWGGQFENLQSARQQLYWIVPLCFAMILFLLYTALQAISPAILVFSGVPLAITGGILTLWLRDLPFSISAAVGFIALSGIAVLNGLVMITSMIQLIQQGIPLKEAIINGALVRLRPVLMTALVASLGFIPMALSTGTGAEVQRPIATVVIGGLFTSTFLTLFVLPALCILFLRSQSIISDKK